MGKAGVGDRTTWGLGWALIGVWAMLALLLDVFWVDLDDRLSILFLLFPLALWIGAVWLACSIAARGVRERAWAPTVFLLAAMVSVGTLQALGEDDRPPRPVPRPETRLSSDREGHRGWGGPARRASLHRQRWPSRPGRVPLARRHPRQLVRKHTVLPGVLWPETGQDEARWEDEFANGIHC